MADGEAISEVGEARAARRAWIETLWHGHAPEARALAARLIGAGDADDVVQEAFLRLARYARVDDARVDRRYVLAVVRNAARDARRRLSRERAAARRWGECCARA